MNKHRKGFNPPYEQPKKEPLAKEEYEGPKDTVRRGSNAQTKARTAKGPMA